jgi:plasmid rolling circle replication initiator protein Rep
MEVELKTLVRNKLVGLLQEKNIIESKIKETISIVIEANDIDINDVADVTFTDDLSKLIVEVKPSAEK